jgi:AcrR family transcriptional regulator
MPAMPEGSDVRSRKRERTRAEILDAAWGLARRDGLAALSLRDLGAAVGMRAPSLYTYFGSKHDLYDAMFAQGMQQFADEIVRSPRGPTARDTLRNRVKTFVRVAAEDPLRYDLLFGRPVPGFVPSPESLSIGLSSLAGTRELARAAGLVSERAFDLLIATSRGLVAMQNANEPGGDRWIRLTDEVVEILVDHYTSAGSPRPPQGGSTT